MTWRSPYGAVRLTLGGSGRHPNGVEVCFLGRSNFTTAKISLEHQHHTDEESHSPLEPLVTLSPDNPQTVNEICVRQSSDMLNLYLEVDHDMDSYTIGAVQLQYSVDTLEKLSPKSQDPEEGKL